MLPIEGIYGFKGDYSFLSNFYPCEIEYENDVYPSVEHAYQAAKTLNLDQRTKIRLMEHPGQAKKYGRLVHMKHSWPTTKVMVMESLLRKKFTGYHDLSLKLYQTGDIYIEETNTWGDTFWGVCNGKGHNVLGNLLMKIRGDIKSLYEPD